MRDNCEKCGIAEATVHVTYLDGIEQHLCVDCDNENSSELLGIENYTDFPREFRATDADGVLHTFEIAKRVHPTGILWEANEDQGYKFALYAEFKDEPAESIKILIDKIDRGVSKKYIVEHNVCGRKAYYFKENKVAGRIEYDSECEELPMVVIDGKRYTWENFGRMLLGNEGWNFKMEILEAGLDDGE